MRGGTSYCGVPALSEALRELQRAATAGDIANALLGLQRVEKETDRLLRER
jgi:hypothetical protein